MKRTLNTTINRSKSEKNDEHYTQLADIENKVRHYRDQFKDMTVLCNCDDLHEYDLAGNSITASCNSITNDYTANNLNQYTSVGRRAPTPPPATSISHDIDGNLTNCAPWSFTWDSGNRLTTVSSNGVQIAAYAYDTFGRRVKKTTADTTTHFFYDGWNLVREVEMRGTETNVVKYVWGKDLSGSFQGAGGVGGLLYEKRNGAIYIPFQDAFGNIMGYWDTNGVIVAEYTYDAFGRTISPPTARSAPTRCSS